MTQTQRPYSDCTANDRKWAINGTNMPKNRPEIGTLGASTDTVGIYFT